MPFSKLMGKRQSLNLEHLRRQEWGQDCLDSVTPTQVSRLTSLNGEAVMVSNQSPERKPQSVDWGEEKVDGALYHVVLKKVRYRTTNKLPLDEFVSHLEWETQKRLTLKAGTLEKLIEHLSPASECIDEVDPGYLIAFLTMYQTFSSAEEVVSLLLERFRTVKKLKPKEFENVMRGTVKVMLVWLEHFPDDFRQEPGFKLLGQIQTFATSELNENSSQELLKKTQQVLDKIVIMPADPSDVSPPSSCTEDSVDGCENSFFSDLESNGLLDFQSSEIAEQLTLIDAELFKSVVPQHCVGCIWSRRDKNDNSVKASSVRATVNQFNAVSHRVVSTILLGDSSGSPSLVKRAKRIEAWIEIAQECRELKNFSSLKAIVSALQSASIHRLKKTWSSVSRNHITSFEELSKLVSEDSNQQTGREVLRQEGTATKKTVEKKSSLTRKGTNKMSSNGHTCTIGTVPYLGTFLTDLMMLDTAYPDFIDGNLINFEKRQKEFEIIAQIKLFQEAAKNYYILPNKEFRIWFDSLETLSENDCFTLSCSLEASSISKRQGSLFRSRKMKSENDLVSASSKEGRGDEERALNHRRQDSRSSCASEGSPHFLGSGHIIRVTFESKTSCNLYKSIWVSEGDRTAAVIRTCLVKHHLDNELPGNYTLVQVLANGNEVTIPDGANVYYAMASKTQPLTFVLRKVAR